MAVVALKSDLITAADATPPTIVPAARSGGRVRAAVAVQELANGDSIASTYRLVRLPSNARVISIGLLCDAITSGAADFGLYQTAANGGAVVDVDCYATAQSIASAITTVRNNIAFEARNIDAAANRVWQDGGLTADTQREYDLVMTLTAATTAAGTVTVLVEYALD